MALFVSGINLRLEIWDDTGRVGLRVESDAHSRVGSGSISYLQRNSVYVDDILVAFQRFAKQNFKHCGQNEGCDRRIILHLNAIIRDKEAGLVFKGFTGIFQRRFLDD